ncbi:MAG: PAS domain S-box protein [Spirochaetales bacterium]|nr:PAS domain S-box protein [Spirochaetales bacterium]
MNPLEEENRKLKQYIDIAGAIIVVINRKYQVTFINKEGCTILGYDEEEILGSNWFDNFIPERMRDRVKKVFNQIMSGDLDPVEYYENPVITRDGRELHIAWHNSYITDNDGNLISTLSSGLDITEVTRTNANLRAMIENTDDYIMIADKNGFPAMFNENYKKIIETILGIEMKPGIKPHKQLEDKESVAFWDNLHKRVFTGEKFMIEFNIEVKGVMRYFEFRFYPVIENGNVVGFTEHSRDITKQKQLEENLRHAEKMRVIGQLAGGIAHDFNNQLTGIMGCADLLKQKLIHDPELFEIVSTIVKSASRSAELTQQLLAFARKGSKITTQIHIHTMLEELISMLQRSIQKKINISLHADAGMDIVDGDASFLQNALLNIALNARDAMPGGGEFIIRTKTEEITTTDNRLLDVTPGSYICIEMEDRGTGIPQEILSRIFEPYFTTKENGTGMGLAAAYGSIKQHGGTINVKSESGKGTCFSVFLPLTPHITPVEENHVDTGNASKSENRTIMIIEDEEHVLKATSFILDHYHYKTVEFLDAIRAIEYYKSHYREINVVLLDLVMPAIDGEEVFEELKKINPEVSVIVMSGYSINSQVQDVLDKGAKGFIQKPFKAKTLIEQLATIR